MSCRTWIGVGLSNPSFPHALHRTLERFSSVNVFSEEDRVLLASDDLTESLLKKASSSSSASAKAAGAAASSPSSTPFLLLTVCRIFSSVVEKVFVFRLTALADSMAPPRSHAGSGASRSRAAASRPPSSNTNDASIARSTEGSPGDSTARCLLWRLQAFFFFFQESLVAQDYIKDELVTFRRCP